MRLKKRAAFLVFGLALGLALGFVLSKSDYGAHERPPSLAAQKIARPEESGKAHVGDTSLGYRILGTGKPLLLIMGYAGTMEAWDPRLLDALATSRRVILFDNRGMGASARGDSSFSIALFAKDALGLLDALNIPKADILGWSMGSLIAQEMALAAPEKTGKLILYGSAPDTKNIMKALEIVDRLPPEAFVAQLFPENWAKKNPDIFSKLPAAPEPPDPVVVEKQKEALALWTGSGDSNARIKNETLLIVGEEDTITPPEDSLSLASKIPAAWLVRFKNAGHWLMYQAPEDFARVVLLFLNAQQSL